MTSVETTVGSFFKQFTARQLSIVGISVPILLLLIVGWLQWESVRDYRAAREWVSHTRIVMLQLESLLSCVNDAETGQRGYLLTHKESYLEPYNNALNSKSDELQTLRQLTSDNPIQQKNLDDLEPLVNAKFNELAQTVALEKNSDHDGALKIVMSDVGKNTMDQIRAMISSMHATERGLLQQREETYQAIAQRNSMLSSLLTIIGVSFIICIFWLLRRSERMDEMVKICAWSKLIEYEGQWLSIEDYLTRRFNSQITHGISDVEAKKMLMLIENEKVTKAA